VGNAFRQQMEFMIMETQLSISDKSLYMVAEYN